MMEHDRLDAISKQVAQLLQHVGEVRQSTRRLERRYDGLHADVESMRGEIISMRSAMKTMRSEMKSMRSEMKTMRSEMKIMRDDVNSMCGEMKFVHDEMNSMREEVRALDEKVDKRTEFLAGKIEHHVGALREDVLRDRIRFDEERYIRRFRQREIEERLKAVEARVTRLESQSSSSS